jgi:hypothetical protein
VEEEIVDYEYYRRGNEGHQRELLKLLFHIFRPFILGLIFIECFAFFQLPPAKINFLQGLIYILMP